MVRQTPLYQLIQYTPTTDEVLATPLVIFPPWINRFYILDLSPRKASSNGRRPGAHRVHGQLEVGRREHRGRRCWTIISRAQIDAIDTIRDVLDVQASTRSAIAWRARRLPRRSRASRRKGEADKVKTATFFTAQVDFAEAGDLKLFTGDEPWR